MFLDNFMNVLVQIANKMGLQKMDVCLQRKKKLRGLSPRANCTDRATEWMDITEQNFERGNSDPEKEPEVFERLNLNNYFTNLRA
jgi:hypothetical protein